MIAGVLALSFGRFLGVYRPSVGSSRRCQDIRRYAIESTGVFESLSERYRRYREVRVDVSILVIVDGIEERVRFDIRA